LTPTDDDSFDQFGWAVDVSNDGDRDDSFGVSVSPSNTGRGAPGAETTHDEAAGSVSVFENVGE